MQVLLLNGPGKDQTVEVPDWRDVLYYRTARGPNEFRRHGYDESHAFKVETTTYDIISLQRNFELFYQVCHVGLERGTGLGAEWAYDVRIFRHGKKSELRTRKPHILLHPTDWIANLLCYKHGIPNEAFEWALTRWLNQDSYDRLHINAATVFHSPRPTLIKYGSC